MIAADILRLLDAEIEKALAIRDHVIADAGERSIAYSTGNLDGLATARAIVAKAAGCRRPLRVMTDPRERRCRACEARIIFLRTVGGKQMPCDAATVAPTETLYNAALGHASHYATCPKGAQFRAKEPKT